MRRAFMSFPVDLPLSRLDGATPARVSRVAGSVPAPDGIERAANVLAGAAQPLILSGDGAGSPTPLGKVERA